MIELGYYRAKLIMDSFAENLSHILSLYVDDHDPNLELRAMERRIAYIVLPDNRKLYVYVRVKLEED